MDPIDKFDKEVIRAQLERILQSPDFKAPDKQREFLRFIIGETLKGRSTELKGFTIAVEVYGRTSEFDPRLDPIVRVEAGRLRRALEHYYLTGGRDDSLRIRIPKGGYVPAFQVTGKSPAEPESTFLAADASIAVIPLVNLSGDKNQEYFTDGLTEELTAELARYQDFKVIATQSSMRYRNQKVEPKEVGKDLNARFLLTGSVRRDSNAVKIMVKLIDTSIDEQIWGESYKRDYTAADLIGIQEDVAHRVVGVIADQWGLIERRLSRESFKRAPADMNAYDAVLRFYHYETVLTVKAFKDALAALELATEIEPDYGLAWSMLSHMHADNYALGFCEVDDSLSKALTYAKKGVALAPETQFAYDALALVYFHIGDKEELLRTIEKTIALNPNSPYIVGVAGWHMALFGEWDRGLALLEKGMNLNPYYPSWFHMVPFMDCYRRGDFEKAYAEALRFNYPELYLDPMLRAAALGRLGRQAEANIAIKQLLNLEPDFAVSGRKMISAYVKVDDLVDEIVKGLREAGLADLK